MGEETGGPAFPSQCRSVKDEMLDPMYRGMTLRDYFAAKAMQGVLTSFMSDGTQAQHDDIPILAKASYMIADAMLEAREK